MANPISGVDTIGATMSLEERIQRLAQELKDIVFDFYILTVTSDDTVTVDTGYEPPKQLQINRASRRTAAARYYSSSTFVIDGFDKTSAHARWLYRIPSSDAFEKAFAILKWLKSLPVDHSSRIETLSLPEPFTYSKGHDPETNLLYWYDRLLEDLKESSGLALRNDCLRMGLRIEGSQGQEVVVCGKRDELAEEIAGLLVEWAHAEALEALTNGSKDWIEV